MNIDYYQLSIFNDNYSSIEIISLWKIMKSNLES